MRSANPPSQVPTPPPTAHDRPSQPGRAQPGRAQPGPDRAQPGPTRPGPTRPDPTGPNPARPDRAQLGSALARAGRAVRPKPVWGGSHARFGQYASPNRFGGGRRSARSGPGRGCRLGGGFSVRRWRVFRAVAGKSLIHHTARGLGGRVRVPCCRQRLAGGMAPTLDANLVRGNPPLQPSPGPGSAPARFGRVRLPAQARPPRFPAQARPPRFPAQARPPQFPAQARSPQFPAQARPPQFPAQARPPQFPAQARSPQFPGRTATHSRLVPRTSDAGLQDHFSLAAAESGIAS
jgi:hypothetical protein